MIFRQENRFSGSFLYVKCDEEDNEETKHDITGLVSMTKAYMERGLSYGELIGLICAISREGRLLEEKNLSLDGWILNPEYIFITPGHEKNSYEESVIRIIYHEGKTDQVFKGEINYLSEYIIENVDYEDEKAVRLAYDFYLQVYYENYVFDKLLRCD